MMNHPKSSSLRNFAMKDLDNIKTLFTEISPQYDRMNHIMTLGRDAKWRKSAVQLLNLRNNDLVLDLGAGTGEITLEIMRQNPKCTVIAADATPKMIKIGQEKTNQGHVHWLHTDALNLPFANEKFDAVISGFLRRNVNNLRQCLLEQNRVLKHNGKIVVLDTTPPQRNYLYPFIQYYLHTIIPWLGKNISKNEAAYHYLPNSTEAFLRPESLVSELEKANFINIRYHLFMFHTIAIHAGRKP